MSWKSSKPKESSSTAIVRQDSRTTVKTSAAQSETTSTSVKNATIYNNNKNTVEYRTTKQTVTHKQQARVTEIVNRRTASKEELEELLRQANFTKTETTTTKQQQKPPAIPAITWNNGKSPLNSPKNKSANNNNNSLSPSQKNFFRFDDSPRSFSTTTTTTNNRNNKPPTTPTIAKVQNTFYKQDDGRTVTSNVEQQRIKLNMKPYNLYSPQSALPKLDAKPFNLSSPNSPLTKPLSSTITATTHNEYKSPYRSIYTSTQTPATKSISGAPTASIKSSWFSTPTATTTATATARASPSASSTASASNMPASTSTDSRLFGLPTTAANATGAKKKSKLQPGYAYIFNNERFDDPNNEYRVGSSEDVKQLKATFEKYKLKINLIENATLNKIESTVKKIETKDYSNYSCLVIVILSHGTRHDEVCAKDGTYNIDDKILFPILRNRTMIDKPKFFFVQACKGALETGAFHKDAVQPHGSPNEIYKCYSTFEGYVSLRTEKGSIFIQTLCQYLNLFGNIKNIKEIMEQVTLYVKQQTRSKQIPSITSTLTQPYIFGDYV